MVNELLRSWEKAVIFQIIQYKELNTSPKAAPLPLTSQECLYTQDEAAQDWHNA